MLNANHIHNNTNTDNSITKDEAALKSKHTNNINETIETKLQIRVQIQSQIQNF